MAEAAARDEAPRLEGGLAPQIVIVSGLSGAGKSHVLHCFEDVGFFCVDNLPPPLIPTFVHLCTQGESRSQRIGLGIDIRGREFLAQSFATIERLKSQGYRVEILFLEARDEVLVRRFSETRRPHPLARDRPIVEGIAQEREELQELRNRADLIIDTSGYTVHELKAFIAQRYLDRAQGMAVTLISFGYKYGPPYQADLLFDVRFLKNPNFVEPLRPLSGEDPRVASYVLGQPETGEFVGRLEGLIDFLLPLYEAEGRTYLTIGVGCTGGRHRSVVVIDRLRAYFEKRGVQPTVRHRDLDRQVEG
ncbi:MAG: RNase adaptor protein RapZ [Nitrospirae bacterium RIFCSPHIGHO2_01_FULL_66_17]|nr:MAG: RNase adaptor protein RapZ [Nitrospirae bacterium RIFCSPHIGHO2_01_FULL_66_17]